MSAKSTLAHAFRFELQLKRPTEEYILIWLGDLNDNNDILNELRHYTNDIHIFIDCDECIDFISEFIPDQKLIFVINTINTANHELVTLAAESISQVSIIYVLIEGTADHHRLEQFYVNYSKIHCMPFKLEPLKNDLSQFMKTRLHYQLISFQTMPTPPIRTTKPIGEKTTWNKQEASFMYAQLVKEILLEFELTSVSKAEMIEFCRAMYVNNASELTFIDELESNPHNRSPIYFYTVEHFLYRMLNRALRLQEIDKLYHLRYYIRQLHDDLKRIHNENHEESKSIEFLYRGQGMSAEEFEKIQRNIGGLLSFNAFLSTSADLAVAYMYSETMLAATDTLAVLMQIDVLAEHLGSNVFASISNLTQFTDEQEYLFSMGAIFRIVSIEQQLNGIYIVRLQLTSDHDEQLAYLKWFMDTNLRLTHHRNSLFRLAGLMNEMSQYSYAEYFFTLLLQDENTKQQPRVLASIYGNMGYMYKETGDARNAVYHYERALKLYEEDSPKDNQQSIASLLANVGEIYIAEGKYEQALRNYKRALAIDMNPANEKKPNPEYVSNRINQMGVIYERTGQYSKAIDCYEKCLQIRLTNMPPNHPSLLTPYNNIALLYDRCAQPEKALDIYMKILEISTGSLTHNHLKFATLYHNIACNLDDLGRFEEALVYAQKAFDVVKNSPLPSNHEIYVGNREHLEYLERAVLHLNLNN